MKDNNLIADTVAAATQNIKEREYWLDKLSGGLVKSNFPIDYSKKTTPAHRQLENKSFQFDDTLFPQFMKLRNNSDYSLHMILVAGIALLLEKYSGNTDILMGSPIYKQEITGKFINTILVLRNKIEGQMTFKELLLQVRSTLLEAVEHQNYPIETLLYKLNLEVEEEVFSLFDVAVLLDNIHDEEYIGHLDLPLSFIFHRSHDKITGILKYDASMYQSHMLDGVIDHLKNLMETAIFALDRKVCDIKIFSPREEKQLLVDFNDTSHTYPGGKRITELIEEAARKNPQSPALVFEGKELTYAELMERSHGLARLLVDRGVKAESIVGLMVERSFEMVIGILGILKAGGAYLPLDCKFPPERIKYMVEDSEVSLMLTQNHLKDTVPQGLEIIDLDDPQSYTAQGDVDPGGMSDRDLAYVIYTSGSTGKAKGVAVEHRSIINTLLWRRDYYNFNQDDAILQVLGYTFDSSVEDIFTTLISGARLILVKQDSVYDLQYMKKVITANNVTYFLIIPGFYQSFLEEIGEDLKGLRAITVAGDKISESLVRRHFEVLGNVRLYNEYGPTENSVCSTAYEFDAKEPVVLIGKPIHNVSCYIVNKNDQLAPPGVSGELWVSGNGVTRGYLKRPELTGEKFIENPFKSGERVYRTGDLCRRLPHGDLEFLGRLDHQVKIRGFRIELGEIEKQLLNADGIHEAVVMAFSEDKGGGEDLGKQDKYLCAYFVSPQKYETADLRNILTRNLPDYMVPAYFIQLDEIPLTPNGKIDRKALPKPETGVSFGKYVAPRDEVEEKLVKIWSEVLNIEEEKVGIENNFFDLGGHSLNLVIFVSRIFKEFGVQVPITQIFESPTIKQIAHNIQSKNFVEESVMLLNQAREKKMFFFPPQIGYGIYYMNLASVLQDYSVYAFSYIEEEDRLKQYVEMITDLQPIGPYILSGYSAGGKLTAQVAGALEKNGQEVADIILFDCSYETETEIFDDRIMNAHIKFVEKYLEDRGVGFLKDKVVEKSVKYMRYYEQTTNLDVLNANIHLILSEDNHDVDWTECWHDLTKKSSKVYRGTGSHQTIFNPGGPLEKNLEIIKGILKKSEA